MAGAIFAACSSDDNLTPDEQQPAGEKTYTLTVQATKDGESAAVKAATRALSLDGKTLNATWAQGERVTVYNVTRSADLGGYLEAQSSGASTTLKGTLTGTIENGDVLKLKFLSPSYSTQDGTQEYISSHCDYAEATVTVTDASTPSVTTTDAEFENKQAIVKFTLKNKATNAAISATQLVVSDGTNSYTVTPASATSEIYVALPGFSGQTVSLTANVAGKLYTYSKNPVTFTNGQYYEITVKMSTVGALVGKFTINSSGDKVHFSQGNLQAYNATANSNTGWTWSFAEHQYDYIGNATANTSINGSMTISTAGTVDLFGWIGSSAPKSSKDSYGIQNGGSYYHGTTYPDVLNHDWGHNAITNGGNTADIWRTLTKDEWVWILGPTSSPTPGTNCRTSSTVGGTANARFTLATISETNKGMIIFPDSYTAGTPTGVTWGAINTYSDYATTCTTAGWEALEIAGCVFLPAAGRRQTSTSVSNVGSHGLYWSSTSKDTNSSVYLVLFYSSNCNPEYYDYRSYASSVRLVYDAE